MRENPSVRHTCGVLAATAMLAGAIMQGARTQAATPVLPEPALVAAAGAARFELAVNPTSFLAAQDATSRATFAVVLHDEAAAHGTIAWQRLFAGALQVRHQQGDEGETLWFNPVFDTGLLVRWHRGQGTWIATSARWLLGREIRGDALGTWVPLPIQAVDASRFNTSFTLVASTTLGRAAAADWAAPATADSDSVELQARLAAAQDALAKMQNTRGYQTSLADAHRLLERSTAAAQRPGAALSAILNRLGTVSSVTLQPVSAYRRGKEGWTLVMQSPWAPGVAVLVHFLDARHGAATVMRVSVTNYTHPGVRS